MEVTVKEKPVIKSVLMVIDHFNRYIQSYTTARVLYNELFSL